MFLLEKWTATSIPVVSKAIAIIELYYWQKYVFSMITEMNCDLLEHERDSAYVEYSI